MRNIQLKDNLEHLYDEDKKDVQELFDKTRFAEVLQILNSIYGNEIED
jgi:hypothetical protein